MAYSMTEFLSCLGHSLVLTEEGRILMEVVIALIEVYSSIHLQWLGKMWELLVKVANVPSEIQTKHFLNVRLEL
jgi:hypothetical protein